ncbi:hypothetical protein BJ322DRAFT_1111792 [Thelephora terrestris]|uniref:Uncharacterized protein n=1 Tax=Thelephora terrestris TaxID=56493 RepID=A0A9P6H815_9AGAM|nr:hypothetical protein BJ322DRAFT_1111792 [Thelephora terrestris]
MDLSSSWDPTKGTNGLAPFPAFAQIQTYDESPSSQVLSDAGWTKRELMPYLTGSGDGSEAIWESVLAIWRLRALEKDLEDGGKPFCALWQVYLTAWLQRHYDLCQHYNIPPLDIITQYGEAAVATNNLPREMLPPSRRTENEPTPAASNRPPKRAASQPQIQDNDVKMDNQPAATNQRPAKRSQTLVADAVIPSKSPRPQPRRREPHGTVPTPEAKHDLPELPHKEEGISKRSHSSTKTIIISDDEVDSAACNSENGEAVRDIATLEKDSGNDSDAGVEPTPADLSGETHLEGARLNRNRFPEARDKKCSYCEKNKYQDRCFPAWYSSRSVVQFRCRVCVSQQERCSFKDMNFGIVKMPKVTKSKAGTKRCKRDLKPHKVNTSAGVTGKAAPKKITQTRAKKPVPPGPVPKDPVPSISALTRSHSATATRATTIQAAPPTAPPTTVQSVNLTPPTHPIHTTALPGVGPMPAPAELPMALIDLCRFETTAQGKGRSRVFLEQERIRLRSTMNNEKLAAYEFLSLIEARRVVAKHLLKIFNQRIVVLGGQGVWVPDSEEESESVPGSGMEEDRTSDTGFVEGGM